MEIESYFFEVFLDEAFLVLHFDFALCPGLQAIFFTSF
jgi:hypothetical protein